MTAKTMSNVLGTEKEYESLIDVERSEEEVLHSQSVYYTHYCT